MEPETSPPKACCRICLIPENLLLFDDYFPISESYLARLNARDQHRVTRVGLSDGVCQSCLVYQANYDPAHLKRELLRFIKDCKAGQPALLALSGGKDSLTALYLLRKVYQVETVAFLYQNGFIPEAVIARAQAWCDEFGTRLDVVTEPLYQAFRQEYALNSEGELEARTGSDFCQTCSSQINRFGLELMDHYGASWLVMGNKVYTELEPKVSSITERILKGKPRQVINLLFTAGIDSAKQAIILKAMNWSDPHLPGYTTNCYIPGLVEQARSKRLNAHSDQGYIERELRSGAFTRAEARALLSHPKRSPASIEALPPDLKQALFES